MRHLVGIALVVLLASCGDNKGGGVKQDAGPDAMEFACGNGMVDANEQCDDGDANGGQDARCTTQCTWVCLDDTWCTDNEPCNGAETCVDHACVKGTPEADGVTCGTGRLCRNESCTDSVCGDNFTTAPNEECDDANSTQGDGCENNCKYSCLSTDNTRNCTPADACAGQGTCNDTTHTCTPGTPLADNTACGTGGYCKTGVCTQPMCGNGQTEPGEMCDLGSANGTMGSGCKANCTYECVTPATDCPAAPACQMATCNSANACANVPNTALNGMMCSSANPTYVCNNGACVPPSAVCGNGTTEAGEECDFGSGNNTAGSGCEPNCQFSCDQTPTDTCNDGNPCDGVETCTNVTVNSRPGKRCMSTAAPAQGTSCGPNNQICLGMVCVTSMCGDGFVNPLTNEQCEPPNTATCSATCRNIVCGDGVRAGTEQCDDSNTTNLDGCDSVCKFEQCHRANTLSMAFNTNTYCTRNALGGAIVGGTAQNQIGSALTTGVNNGSITIELKAYGLDDLTGTNDPQLTLGVLTGTPVAGTGYNGAADLDWWYTTAASVINATRMAVTTMPATIVAKMLNAGPANITLTISLAGVPATLEMLRAKVRGNVGATSTPLVSTGSTPGHRAQENLDPTLVSFATVTGGELCGDVVAQSLANVPIPTALVGCTILQCSQCYTATNTLLDVIVGGCNTLIGTQIQATPQADGNRAGNTDVYRFTRNATTKAVNGCTRNMQAATLSECLTNATYSSFFRFTTGRTIAK